MIVHVVNGLFVFLFCLSLVRFPGMVFEVLCSFDSRRRKFFWIFWILDSNGIPVFVLRLSK